MSDPAQQADEDVILSGTRLERATAGSSFSETAGLPGGGGAVVFRMMSLGGITSSRWATGASSSLSMARAIAAAVMVAAS